MNYSVNDFRFNIAGKELLPIIVGGMGVDISTSKMAVKVAELGGIGHISDAMVPVVTDKYFDTSFAETKYEKYKESKFNFDKSSIHFDSEEIQKAQGIYVRDTMAKKRGPGLIFLNCMEKLLLRDSGLLKARLVGAMENGIDGITLSAGLHLHSMETISDHPRFRDVLIGIIVSSVRALKLFLARAARLKRMPDYIVVEGPLAGGHLGFGMDWKKYELKNIVQEVLRFLRLESLNIPVVAAGGIFTGTDAVDYLKNGVSAVQLATRFTVTEECGLPLRAKHAYLNANEEDVEVSMVSPTGYPMRVLKNSPALTKYIRPNCEIYGFLLDKHGHCSYIDSYQAAEKLTAETGAPFKITDKICLCTHMRNYKLWTCGHYVYRLKDTTNRLDDGSYQLLTTEHVFKDYLFSLDHSISLPPLVTNTSSVV